MSTNRSGILLGMALAQALGCASAPEPVVAPPEEAPQDLPVVLGRCQEGMTNRDAINTLYDADRMYAHIHAQQGVEALPKTLQDEVKRIRHAVETGTYLRANVMTPQGVLHVGGYLTPYFRVSDPEILRCQVSRLAQNRDAPNQCREIPEDLALYNTCALESLVQLGVFPEAAEDLRLLKSLRQPERKAIRYDNIPDSD